MTDKDDDDLDHIKDENFRLLVRINNILGGSECDESEVNHQIDCHADTVPQVYRALAKKVEQAMELLNPVILDWIDPTFCKLCGNKIKGATAHPHEGGYVGDECCWDEKLRATE